MIKRRPHHPSCVIQPHHHKIISKLKKMASKPPIVVKRRKENAQRENKIKWVEKIRLDVKTWLWYYKIELEEKILNPSTEWSSISHSPRFYNFAASKEKKNTRKSRFTSMGLDSREHKRDIKKKDEIASNKRLHKMHHQWLLVLVTVKPHI